MITLDNNYLRIKEFPDHSLNATLAHKIESTRPQTIRWRYESDSEMMILLSLVRTLQDKGVEDITLIMPYIPNSRMDRVEDDRTLFTLKYFTQFINSLGLSKVCVVDPHSSIPITGEYSIHNVEVYNPYHSIKELIHTMPTDIPLLLFFPDEGARLRYENVFQSENLPYLSGEKVRNWSSGEITDYKVEGKAPEAFNVLIIDDICSYGITAYHSALALRKLGALDITFFVTHCENTVDSGPLKEGIIQTIYTLNTLYNEDIAPFNSYVEVLHDQICYADNTDHSITI